MCSGEHTVLEFSAGQTNALSLHSAEQDLRKQRPICSLLIYTDSKQVQKNYEISFLHNCTKLSLFFSLRRKHPHIRDVFYNLIAQYAKMGGYTGFPSNPETNLVAQKDHVPKNLS